MALSIKPYIENKERIHLIGIGGEVGGQAVLGRQ